MDLGVRLSAVFLILWGAIPARGAVVIGGPPPSGNLNSIAFDTVGVVNPEITFSNVPNVGDLTVSFGTHFVGQTLGRAYNSLASTAPNAPLQLNRSEMVKTMFDLASPVGVSLGGMQGLAMYTTPLAILFSSGVDYVAFDLGHLDENSPTLIEAYDVQGNSLGVFGGLSEGYNRYSLTETTGADTIAGVSIYLPPNGLDLEGFGINTIDISHDGGIVPEPSTLVVWSLLAGCSCAGVWWNRRRTVAKR